MGVANVLVTLAVVWKFGWVPKGLHAAILAHALISLAAIDWRTRWLPDSLTQPVLWLGLLLQLPEMSAIVGADQGLIGAALGYALPLLASWLFMIARGKAAIGGGDIKLSAMVGAWLGPGAVLFIWAAAPLGLLLAFVPFSGVGRMARKVVFGPWLAGAALLWLLMIFPGSR
jgi:leader peptidase (prepilin peptidase)/N-methyltransferase